MKFKGFISGIILGVLLAVSIPSFADSIDIIFNNIKVVVDNQEVDLRDANGTKIKPILYNGTNYLPLRAISQALGKSVQWDSRTGDVYINCEIPNNGTPQQSYIFRKANWGMSKSQIVTSEGRAADVNQDRALVYKSISIGGKTTNVSYIFNDFQQLSGIVVESIERHSNKNDYISDFNTWTEVLTTRYGKPILNSPVWKNDLFKDSPKDYGLAIGAGHLSYIATWKYGDSEISNFLHGDNYTVEHNIVMESKKLPQPSRDNGL